MKTKSMFYRASPETFEKASELRKNETLSEKKLWARLCKSQLRKIRFKRQHPIGNYIADFYCHKAKLVIEIDGKYHQHGEQKTYDANRDQFMVGLGLTVIRFSNAEIAESLDAVVGKIESYLDALAHTDP